MYRGGEGQWAYYLHRFLGVLILLYLLLHATELTAPLFGSGFAASVSGWFRTASYQLLRLLAIGAIIYHGLNGIRIMLMDFTSWGTRIQKYVWYVVIVLFLLMYIPIVNDQLPAILNLGGR
ncbi:succinate dehydrogenase, cytochrome b556 subunit [Oceanithermus sp.]